MQGRETPIEAARLRYCGAGWPVSAVTRFEVKWLQLRVSRLYVGPRKAFDAYYQLALFSFFLFLFYSFILR